MKRRSLTSEPIAAFSFLQAKEKQPLYHYSLNLAKPVASAAQAVVQSIKSVKRGYPFD
jgi:hypothetical protein